MPDIYALGERAKVDVARFAFILLVISEHFRNLDIPEDAMTQHEISGEGSDTNEGPTQSELGI